MSWYEERFIEDPKRHRFDCVSCGRGMWFPKCKHGKYKTCGGECAEAVNAQKLEDRKRNCNTCGTVFHPRPRQLSKGHGLFCSQKCNVKAREAMNAPDVQQRSKETLKAMIELGQVNYLRGEKHPCWVGGLQVVRERGKQRKTIRTREYRKENPDKVREFALVRSTRKHGRLPRGTVKQLGAYQRWKCVVCKTCIKDSYHVDHIVPLAKNGTHTKDNIQLLCPSCNVRKSAKDPIDFMQSRGFLL